MKFYTPHKHAKLDPLHHYQLAIIFLFIFGFFLLFPYWLFLEELNLDQTIWQWYFVIPWMILYTVYCLLERNKIPKREQISPKKRHIVYWVLLGIIIVLLQTKPMNLERMYSVDFAFAIFTILLADSYWDFTLRTPRRKKNR